jgi:hypothetical protein
MTAEGTVGASTCFVLKSVVLRRAQICLLTPIQVLSFGPDERDLLLMRHEVTIRWPDRRRELRGINLVVYGDVAEDKAE